MDLENALISVIVPVYNVENYLIRAVDSVRRQSHRHVEIILVDDGSTDASGRLCERARQKDVRVRTIHQENRGVSAARNAGIAAASGDYLFFLDPDDTIEPTALEIMLQTMREKNCDLVICGVRKLFLDARGKVKEEKLRRLDKEGFYPNIDLILKLRSRDMNDVDCCGSSCNRLYKKEFFAANPEPFPADIRYCEDVYFSVDILNACRRIYFIQAPLYNYYRYHVSLRKSSMDSFVKNRFDIYKKIHLKIYRIIQNKVDRAKLKECQHNFIDRVILACVNMCDPKSPCGREEVAAQLKRIVNDESVIEALRYYDRKDACNWTDSWTVPFLIRQKRVDYLMHFARKIAKVKYGRAL